jgi:hypothetical protein
VAEEAFEGKEALLESTLSIVCCNNTSATAILFVSLFAVVA